MFPAKKQKKARCPYVAHFSSRFACYILFMMERNENISAVQHVEYYVAPERRNDISMGATHAAALVMLSLPVGLAVWIYAITVLAGAL